MDRWRVGDGDGDVWLAGRSAGLAVEGARRLAPDAAARLVDAWFPPPPGRAAARAQLAEIAGALRRVTEDDPRGDPDGLRGWLREALRDERVVAFRAPPRSVAAPTRGRAAPEEAVPAARAVEEKTWVAIQLVDDDDPPRPVAHARYRVTLPDGRVREGRLDAMGLARIDGIDPGTCRVTFPDYDGEAWSRSAR